MEYIVGLSTAQNLAMSYASADVQEWINNAVYARASIAIDEICKKYMDYKLNNNLPITVTSKEDMVVAAFEEDIVNELPTEFPLLGLGSTSL